MPGCPGSYSLRTAENDTYKAGAAVPFEINGRPPQEFKVKIGAAL